MASLSMLLVDLGLRHAIVGVVLGSGRVWIAAGDLRDVVAITWGEPQIRSRNRGDLSMVNIGRLPFTLIKSGVAILKEKEES